MEKNVNNTCSATTKKEYSEDYITIRRTVQSEWPEWKISTYNANFATFAHVKKVEAK